MRVGEALRHRLECADRAPKLFALAGELPSAPQETGQPKPKPNVRRATFPTVVLMFDRATHEQSEASLDTPRELARRFLRLAELDNEMFLASSQADAIHA